MTDLLTETEEAIKQERIYKIWHEHGTLIITLVAALILGTAAWSGYSSWDNAQKTAATNAMFDITENENFPDNVTSADALDLPAGLKSLTLLQAATKHIENENTAAAQVLYKDIISTKNIPQDLKDLAILMDTRIESHGENPDYAALIASLAQIKSDSVYAEQSLIESATYSAAMDDYATALTNLETIKDTPTLPETLYLKAQTLSHIYKLRQQDKMKNQGS